MRKTANRMSGFTMVECATVLGLVCVLMGAAVVNTSGSAQIVKAESAVDAVQGQLRVARMIAITQRRNVVVTVDTTFTGPDNAQHLNYQVVTLPGEPAQDVQSLELPGGTQFVLEAGVPDTPMDFGNSAAVYFEDAAGDTGITQFQFTPTGEFTDSNNNDLNGTIFTGVPNVPSTARAVTIMGGAGNVQRFSWTGTEWTR
jgi:type II secretory pathway pseudopilin PulG